jgi:hypothetical protein
MHGLENLAAVGSLQMENNPRLASAAALTSLASATQIFATGNAQLPSCQLTALGARTGAQVTRSGNDSRTARH